MTMGRWLVLVAAMAMLLGGCVCIHSEKKCMTDGCGTSCTQTPVAASEAR